jgi:glycosyltransferase involved in cell wall biosynthesis
VKVLFDTYAFRMQRVGGISRYFAELIRGLPAFGVTPQLFMPIVDNEHAESTRLSIRGSTKVLSRNGTVRRGVHSALSRIDGLLRTIGRYDILHRTYYSEVRSVRRPAVCTVVDMIPDLFPEHFGGNPHQSKRQVAMASDLIFSISECTSRDIVSVYGLDRSRIVTTPLGINLSEFRVSPFSVNPFRAPYVLFVGQRGGYKNFRRFAAALAPLMDRQPGLSLAVVGGGPLSEDETEPFKASGTSGRVFQASVPDASLPKIYREAEVFVFPSEYEGFGIPLLEAFASECPVAASRASCFPEVGGAAIEYFDPRSTDDISHAMSRVLSSSARSDELRALGTERVKQFTWTRTVGLTADGYRRLV